MGSTGRRRPSRRRPSGEPTRRPPFGAPRQPWWGNQEWWRDKQTQHRLIDAPTRYGFLDEPDQHRFLTDPARPGFPDEPGQRRFPDEPAQRRFRDEPARRRFLNAPAQGRSLNAAIWHRWFEAATRHPWYTGLGAGAGFMVLASGVIFILPKSPSAMMTQCGVMPCTSPHTTQAGGRTANRNATRGTTYRFSRAAKATPGASTLPATMPSAMGSAAPQLPPSVTVTYALIVRWYGGMMGEFTIANHGSTAITGWKLSAAFPGDQIQVTWGPIDPNPGGYTVVMEAQPDWPTIAPGASQSGYFIARGNTATPSNCTFDGASCP
jgi:Cellulose binding domain